jgi:ABC-type antimicrobial peptide transport system permease subunit
MAVAILIGLWVFDELNFNKSFKNYDRLGMIYHNLSFDSRIITVDGFPYPLSGELKNNYPEFDDVVVTSQQEDHILGFGETKLSKPGYFVEPQFAEMFSLQMVQGSRNGLKDIHSIMLSQTLAETLVGNDPVGKMIKFDNRDNLMVTGVFEDFPRNSQFNEIKMLIPIDYYFILNENLKEEKTAWGGFHFLGFVLMNKSASFEQADLKTKNICFEKGAEKTKALKPEAVILPMEKWHLQGDFTNGKNTGGKIKFVWMFGLIGIFVLLLACINFMNLSTARSEKRAKEIGIRKVMGSLRSQLINQFLGESLLVVILAFIGALCIAFLLLPWFNELASKKISLPWSNPYFISLSLGFVLVTSLLAGSYPALYLSSFKPVQTLKGSRKTSRLASLPRKIMVVFQFSVSTALFIGTIIVFQQLQHAKDRPLGFDREGIIYVSVRTEDLAKANYNSIRNDLLTSGVVENAAISDFPITGGMSANATITWQGKDPATQPLITMNSCSHDFPKTCGFDFVEGRDFSRDLTTDSTAMIVNETAAKLFSDKSVLGKKVTWNQGERKIVGVIKDQIRWSPFQKQSPHFYYIDYKSIRVITIKINRNVGVHDALTKIETVMKKFDPGAPFDYKFVDDDYAQLFNDEERIGKLTSAFATLAIFISCIGIFGLASFAASQRTKEIGIRKVLGASVFHVWKMLSRDFAGLAAISILIASPVAYYFLNQWLQQYEYRIEISWLIFFVAGAVTVMITLLTVSYQSIRAAMTDPVKTLRTE